MSRPTTVLELRDRIISDGIAEVEQVYDEGSPKREGAIEGFELCRSLATPEDYLRVLRARQRRERSKALRPNRPTDDDLDRYWKHRYATLQVEWVFNCLKVVWGAPSLSGRAMRKVAMVMGEDVP